MGGVPFGGQTLGMGAEKSNTKYGECLLVAFGKEKGAYICGLKHHDMCILNFFKQVHFSLFMCQPALCSAHADLGIGGLQFGGPPLSTGTNGAGRYGLSTLCYYCTISFQSVYVDTACRS